MTKFTVRVELHEARGNDYDDLHDEMSKKGFSKTIMLDGVEHDLPTAEYSYIGSGVTADDVLNMAKAAAKIVKPNTTPSILLTETEKPRLTYGLKETE